MARVVAVDVAHHVTQRADARQFSLATDANAQGLEGTETSRLSPTFLSPTFSRLSRLSPTFLSPTF
jgi:hypothetical protein